MNFEVRSRKNRQPEIDRERNDPLMQARTDRFLGRINEFIQELVIEEEGGVKDGQEGGDQRSRARGANRIDDSQKAPDEFPEGILSTLIGEESQHDAHTYSASFQKQFKYSWMLQGLAPGHLFFLNDQNLKNLISTKKWFVESKRKKIREDVLRARLQSQLEILTDMNLKVDHLETMNRSKFSEPRIFRENTEKISQKLGIIQKRVEEKKSLQGLFEEVVELRRRKMAFIQQLKLDRVGVQEYPKTELEARKCLEAILRR